MDSLESTTKRGPDIQDLFTYEEIAERCKQVRELLEGLNVRCHRDSALSVLLRAADRLSKGERFARPADEVRAVIEAAHANRVASAILDIGREHGALEVLRRMSANTLDISGRDSSTGKDALWEVDLAKRLRRQGMHTALGEPDLVIDLPSGPYSVACKKIYSERGVEAQMRKGVRQIQAAGRPGVVAFNLDDLTPADSIFVSLDASIAGNRLAALNRSFIDRHQREIERYVADGRCDGVLVSTTVIADLRADPQRVNTYSQTTVWTLAPPRQPTSAGLRDLVAGLQRGQP